MNVLAETASVSLNLDPATRRGRVVFSLTNRGGEPAQVTPTPVALDRELAGALAAATPTVQLDAGTTGICLVAVAVPPTVAAGGYRFRLDLVPTGGGPAINGPEITVTVAAMHQAAPPPPGFPWWLVLLGVLMLATASTLLWFALTRPAEPAKPAGPAKPESKESPRTPGEEKPAPARPEPAKSEPAAAEPARREPPKAEPASTPATPHETASRPEAVPAKPAAVEKTPVKPVETTPTRKPTPARQFNQ